MIVHSLKINDRKPNFRYICAALDLAKFTTYVIYYYVYCIWAETELVTWAPVFVQEKCNPGSIMPLLVLCIIHGKRLRKNT
jgi:hypothetical protein